MLDSMDKVRKNQNMPKEMILVLLNRKIARMIRDTSSRKLDIVLGSKKLFEIAKS